MSDFKFNIGDTLTHRASLGMRLFVVERIAQECPGGVQKKYLCRMASVDQIKCGLEEFNEVELVPLPEAMADLSTKVVTTLVEAIEKLRGMGFTVEKV